MKKLAKLLDVNNLPEIELIDMVLDSRDVDKGSLFVAVKGHNVDGRAFIANAIKSNAAAVLSEADNPSEHLKVQFIDNVPVISYYQLSAQLSHLAAEFYGQPAEKLTLVGITGTNGKTTVSQLLAQWAKLLGHKAGVMGTLGNGVLGDLEEASNTTASAIEVQYFLNEFVQQKVDFAALEVSSHGLVQHRVDAVKFDVAVFTNLSRDHLDYHGSMEEYAAAKKRLFTDLAVPHQVINADDQFGSVLLAEFKNAIAVSTNSNYQPTHSQWLKATQVDYHNKGVSIQFESSWGNGKLESPLIGEFNVSNLLLAMASLLSLGYPLADLVKTVADLQGVLGRMETFTAENQATAIVDYAHTPDALEKALQAAKLHCDGNLWCVFGCGGDRDKGKRPLMAKVAEQYADRIVVTTDNPRTEDPEQIETDIVAGFSQMDKVGLIPNREQAIEFALHNSNSRDVVLIAGKGHENYQIIGTDVFYFSDQEIVQKYLK